MHNAELSNSEITKVFNNYNLLVLNVHLVLKDREYPVECLLQLQDIGQITGQLML